MTSEQHKFGNPNEEKTSTRTLTPLWSGIESNKQSNSNGSEWNEQKKKKARRKIDEKRLNWKYGLFYLLSGKKYSLTPLSVISNMNCNES